MRYFAHGLALFVVIFGIAGCAARRPAAAAPVPEVTEDLAALIERGCYRCLEQAYAAAERRGATSQAFESAALLVLRSKELGLDPAAWRERAQTLAAADGTWSAFLEMIDAVPPDRLAGDRDAGLLPGPGRNRPSASLPAWREMLAASGRSPAFRAYLEVALACELERGRTPESNEALAVSVPDSPIAQYRLALCGAEQRPRLAAIRAADPDFVDADYALGRYELERGPEQDPVEAMRRLRAAADAFPASSAIATTIGNLHQSWEEWEPALAAFDAALLVVPRHPDALLGRMTALANLKRYEPAIEAATRLIDGQWFVGQAYYWRAWSHLQLRNLEVARADADSARRLMVNASVFLLSGLIDWRLARLATAEKDFQDAVAMDFGHCDAALYLGGVRAELAKRPEALAALIQARQCYDLSITLRQKIIAEVEAAPGHAQTKARQIAGHARAIRESEEHRADAVRAAGQLERALSAAPAPPQSRGR
jgi:tetratricopeptide (TPR) repeat protein